MTEGAASTAAELRAERDTLRAERDTLRAERDALQAERDTLRAERNALQAERDALRARCHHPPSADDPSGLLRALAREAPVVIYAKDLDGRFVVSNALHAQLIGRPAESILGMTESQFLAPDEAESIAVATREVIRSGHVLAQEFRLDLGGGPQWFVEHIFPLRDGTGEVVGVAGVAVEVTRRHEAEDTVRALKERVIEAQAQTLLELSAPLLQLGPGVIAVPLLGAHDRKRSEHLLEVVAEGLVAHRARFVLLDLTGLRELDRTIAAALARIARVVSLLGAKTMLTGVPPTLARVLVDEDLDLSALLICSTLGEGLARALEAVDSPSHQRSTTARSPQGR